MAHLFLLPDFVEYRPLPDGSPESQLQRPEAVVGAAQRRHEGPNGSASAQGESQTRDKPVICRISAPVDLTCCQAQSCV
jgi:hypothetical protein